MTGRDDPRTPLDLAERLADADLLDACVDAARERKVDQPVLAADRHGRLGAHLGQWVEARALAATQNQTFHSGSTSPLRFLRSCQILYHRLADLLHQFLTLRHQQLRLACIDRILERL